MSYLSEKARLDLRTALRKSYGESFESALLDEEVNEIGELLLTVLAERIKMKIAGSALFRPSSKQGRVRN